MEQGSRTSVRRVRVGTRLSALLRERLARYCAASGVSERSVMEAAVAQYLDASGDLAVILRRFDRVDRSLARHHRDVEFVADALGAFVRVWFDARASAAGASGKAASGTAEDRYRYFVDQLARRMAAGHRFRDDLPAEAAVNDETEP